MHGNLDLTVLRQYLKNLPKEKLIDEIVDLFKRLQPVKDYYQLKLHPEDETQVVAKYKKIIENEFFPTRGLGRARLSVAKKAISDYKKVCRTNTGMADIMLFYVEQGVRFTNAYGDIDEPFYISMEGMYEKALAWIVKYELQDVFRNRCWQIVVDTSEKGWGFHDALSDMYQTTFPNQ